MLFKQVNYIELKRNQKYICDDGFNTYIGIFKHYRNNEAVFMNTKDITILDKIERNNTINIHFNNYSQYFILQKYISLILSTPSLGCIHPFLFNISNACFISYGAITIYEYSRQRRTTSDIHKPRLFLLMLIPCMNQIIRVPLFNALVLNLFMLFIIKYLDVIEYAHQGFTFYEIYKTKQSNMERRIYNKLIYNLFGCNFEEKYL